MAPIRVLTFCRRVATRASVRTRSALRHAGGGVTLSGFAILAAWAFPGFAVAMPVTLNAPGGIVAVPLPGEGQATPRAWFQGQRVLVTRTGEGWVALIGVPLDLKPGEHVLRFEHGATGSTRAFSITPKAYTVQRLTIADPRKVDPAPDDMKRIRREQEVLVKARSTFSERAAVDLDFILPADGPLTSRFGLRRVLNGQPRSSHNGLDLGVPRGTPIRAAAAGTVVATGDFFFAGKTVFVDHGQGLISMYCHLDEIGTAVGQVLERGAPLGKSGMTGRVTGPHLHWTIYMNGAAVDPELFIASRLAPRKPGD